MVEIRNSKYINHPKRTIVHRIILTHDRTRTVRFKYSITVNIIYVRAYGAFLSIFYQIIYPLFFDKISLSEALLAR